LLREDERRVLSGFPGLLRMPLLQQLFGNNDTQIRQTDIVMLLTPRIIRTHELTAQDLAPIYIGPQSNLSLGGGPPPLLAPEPAAAPAPPATPPGAPTPVIPPGSSPIPGMTTLPPTPAPAAPTAPTATPVVPPPVTTPEVTPVTPQPPPPDPVAPPQPTPQTPPAATTAPATQAAGGGGRITVAAPPAMTLGAGPYTVPISISGATRISTLSLSITFNPSVLRVRSVQEGTFMRQGGIAASFTSQPDPSGRVDIVITRPGDQTGAVGTGLLAAILFEPIGAGTSQISVTGVGTVAGGGATAALQFAPATVTVK
jgi:hypothetical protein